MKNYLIFIALILAIIVVSTNADHCSILKLKCEKYCKGFCTKAAGDEVVCNIIKSICKNIGCCHH